MHLHATSRRMLPAFVLVLGLSSCVVEEVPVEEIPQPPGGSSEPVAGTDADGDGLRDDVQSALFAGYAAGPTRTAAIRLAKAFQSLLVDGTTKQKALAAADSMNRAIDCLYALDTATFAARVEGVEGVVVNTGNRAQAYARAGAFLSGGNYSVSTVADNAAECGASL